MGSVGDAYDNARAESFFSTRQAALLSRRRFVSQAEAKMACFSDVDGWCNPVRPHSSLGYRLPIGYETAMQPALTTAWNASPTTVHQDGVNPSCKALPAGAGMNRGAASHELPSLPRNSPHRKGKVA